MREMVDLLMEHQDKSCAEFMSRLLPNLAPESVIGVRTPELRKMAKQLMKGNAVGAEKIDEEAFLKELPHAYFEENQLHGFMISEMKDFDACIRELEAFLPYIDNWATCDQTSPKIFKKRKEELLPHIRRWLESEHPYTVRFAIGMLMQHFLDEAFRPEYPGLVVGIRSEEYYVNMEIAWYMATALAKQWDAVIHYIEENRLDRWTHNKTIQKARESYRITPEQKDYLKSLKR